MGEKIASVFLVVFWSVYISILIPVARDILMRAKGNPPYDAVVKEE